MSRDQLQLKQLDGTKGMAAQDVDVDSEHKPDVSRRASNAGLKREAVQMKGGNANAASVHDAAERGKASPAGKLPHLDTIQSSFGRHDLSQVKAHVGESSAKEIGAEAYATGDHVMFGGAPDLHTAAHEAAHVVQQSQGVNLYGGVGEAGDAHERNADAVADRVVAGKSAEDLLGRASPGPVKAQGQGVQRKAATPKEDHESSDIQSRVAISSSLTLLAKHMHEGGKEILSLVNGAHDTEAGTAPAAEAIAQIFEAVLSEANHVSVLLGTAHLDKFIAQQMASEVKSVLGAFTRFAVVMPRANEFTKKAGDPKDRNPEWIRQYIDGYAAKIGYADTKLEPDSKNPEGTETQVRSTAISDHITGATSAATSVASGNAGDTDRLKLHVGELQMLARDHKGVMSSHKKELATLTTALKDLEKSHPDIAKTIDPLLAQLKALK